MKPLCLLAVLPLAAFAQPFTDNDHAFIGVRSAPPSGAWTPADLGSELKVWLKNESLSGANGDPVNYWADSSGNNNFASNSVAGEALYLTNTGTFGSGILSACLIAANDKLYLTNAAGVCSNVASASIVLVLEAIDMSTIRNPFLFSRGQDLANRFAVYVRATDDFVINGRRNDTDSVESSDAGLTLGTSPIILQCDADWETSAAYIWTNNISAVSDTTWLTDGNTSATNSVAVTLGATSSDSQRGWYAEVLVTVPKLTAANRTNLFNYLDAKFGF